MCLSFWNLFWHFKVMMSYGYNCRKRQKEKWTNISLIACRIWEKFLFTGDNLNVSYSANLQWKLLLAMLHSLIILKTLCCHSPCILPNALIWILLSKMALEVSYFRLLLFLHQMAVKGSNGSERIKYHANHNRSKHHKTLMFELHSLCLHFTLQMFTSWLSN